jgi:hypothetical protein
MLLICRVIGNNRRKGKGEGAPKDTKRLVLFAESGV